MTGYLFGPPAPALLQEAHYLGNSTRAQLTYHDDAGVLVFANPASRRLPKDWLELVRWCIVSNDINAGSQQWKRAMRWLADKSAASTIVSYSDPGQNHTGALYRACNWLWAPTWHRLRPPPTGNGSWVEGDERETVKDRWVYVRGPDARRAAVFAMHDESLKKRYPWAEYREPKWKRGRVQLQTGGGDFQRWQMTARV